MRERWWLWGDGEAVLTIKAHSGFTVVWAPSCPTFVHDTHSLHVREMKVTDVETKD